jgi:hypothetical protein
VEAVSAQSHCGQNAFSPPAPAHLCQQLDQPVHTVPEPDIIWLLIAAVVIGILLRRR